MRLLKRVWWVWGHELRPTPYTHALANHPSLSVMRVGVRALGTLGAGEQVLPVISNPVEVWEWEEEEEGAKGGVGQ